MVGNNNVEGFRCRADLHERHPAIAGVSYFRARTAQYEGKHVRDGRFILDR